MSRFAKSHPELAASFEEKRALTRNNRAADMQHVDRLLRDGYPVKVVVTRSRAARETVTKRAAELGITPPRYSEWLG